MIKVSAYRAASYSLEIALQSGLAFAIIVVAAQSSSLAEFGGFAFVTALVSIQTALTRYGSPTVIYARASKHHNRALPLTLVMLKIVVTISILVYVVSALGFYFFSSNLLPLYLAGGLRIIGSFSESLTSEAHARSAIGEYIDIRLLTGISGLAATLVCWYLEADLVVLAIIWGVEPLFYGLLLVLRYKFNGRLVSPRRANYRLVISNLTPIAIQTFFVVLYMRFDQLYIQYRFGSSDLAIYTSAVKITEIANMAFQVGVLVITPAIIRSLKVGKLTTPLILILGAAAFISLAGFAGGKHYGASVLDFVFGTEYSIGYRVLAIYMLSTCFIFYGGIANRALAERGDRLIQMRYGIAGGLLNIFLTIILVEPLGVEGAAVATVISYFFVAVTLWSRVLKLHFKTI